MVKGKIVPFNNGFRIHVRYISFIPLYYDIHFPTYDTIQDACRASIRAGIIIMNHDVLKETSTKGK